VYDWVLAGTHPVMPSSSIRYTFRGRQGSHNSLWAARMRRPYWPSLAIACQQLRNEFGPCFMNVVEHWIEMGDAEQFIDIFFPDPNVQTYRATLFIHVSQTHSPFKCWSFDILPVMKLLARNKDVKCHFYPSKDAEVLEFLVSNTNSTWKKYVATALARLEIEIWMHYNYLRERVYSKHINFVFKETERLSWQRGKAYTGKGIRLKRFVEEVGLAQVNGWNVRVGVAWDFTKKREGLRPRT